MSPVTAQVQWFVPGRIEVLGKHTDYAGGRSLVAAVDRGITVRAVAGGAASGAVGVTASSDAVPGEVTLVAGVDPQLPAGHWAGYLQTTLDRLTQNFGHVGDCQITVSSTLPLASGLSSSSALVVGVAMALADLHGFPETTAWRSAITDRVDLAGYLACVENGMSFGSLTGHRGVGTFGGSEDHTAMLCCRPHALGQFSFCPIRHERDLSFPERLSFVVLVSGIEAEKTGAARDLYNRASLGMREIVQRWNRATGRRDDVVGDALASGEDDVAERLTGLVADDPYLTARLHQFLEESTRIIPEAADAFAAGDLDTFGGLVDQSQSLSETHLANQVAETAWLAATARELGALAASAFGAGFGGSVWALVPTEDADGFATTWLDRHLRQHPGLTGRATALVTRPGGPARRRLR